MPRIARVVCPGIPYHITQRGNRRETVFFCNDDRQAYLEDLRHYANRHVLEILAYCLMDNHVHLVAVPGTVESLQRALKPVHLLHAQRINQEKEWCGHLWQDRFFSSALDQRHLWAAIRYVELNPVRAGLVRRAEQFRWSSASAHCAHRSDPALTRDPTWLRILSEVRDWSSWLDESINPERLRSLRCNTQRGLPTGSEEFVRAMEAVTGRILRRRPRGRPGKSARSSDLIEPEQRHVDLPGDG